MNIRYPIYEGVYRILTDQVRRPTFASGKTKPVMERRKDGRYTKDRGRYKRRILLRE